MRARVYSNGGGSTGGFTFNGGTLTGALILAGNPSEPLEAASKQYLDSSLVNLNASNISSGILPSGRLPTFVGDLVKPAGSSTINLAPIGVAAGDYIKPTVDTKGRVTGSSSLVEADIPNLSWNKVSLNRPTTLSGYGIGNAIPLSGGTLTGFLSFNGSVTGNLQAVTKQYIDTTLSSASGISIGDIIRKPYTTTPPGFLKCNGAEVSKTTYNSLYATIGDRFSKKQLFTSGKPWQQQYNINETQSGDISNWNISSPLPGMVYNHSVFVTKNRVYICGGFNGSVHTNTVYTTLINSDGTLGTWVTGTSLPVALSNSQTITIKNRVYLLGGFDGTNPTSAVYTAVINSDGTIGTWIAVNNLPIGILSFSIVITYNRIYILGGHDGTTSISTVYTATINSDGTLGSWTTGTSLPYASHSRQAIITKNRVYLCGGYSTTTNTPISTVYTAPINSDGTLGTWTTSNSLPGVLAATASFITKNRIYLFGGALSAGVYVSTVYTAAINSDGTLGTWVTGTSLPGILGQSQLICTKSKLYLLGGFNGSSASSTVYSAVISGGLNDYSSYYSDNYGGEYSVNYCYPGSGKPWSQQYQINATQSADITGWVMGTSLPQRITASQVMVTKNRVYLLGGWNGTSSLSTVYTAPINTDGTLGTWVAGTSLPGALTDSQAIVTKNRVYLCGGSVNGVFTDTVYTAPINSDGTLGIWTSGTALPAALSHSQAIVTKNRVYLLGGYNGTSSLSTVYTAPINSDGTLGTWVTYSNLPTNIRKCSVFTTKNRVYLCGGINSFNLVESNIYTATINADGFIGPWELAGVLPDTLSRMSTIVTKNRVYLLGGNQVFDQLNNLNNVYSATIDANGILGAWTTDTPLPENMAHSQAFMTNSRIYVLGGDMSESVYSASILEGLNDYSVYYDGTITPPVVTDFSATFNLPDLSQNEKFDTVSYIKY